MLVCDEFARTVDRTVDVRLGREMHDRLRADARRATRAPAVAIADVALHENMAGIVDGRGQRIEVACVRQLVQIDELPVRFGDALPNKATADEPGSPCDQNRLHMQHFGLLSRENWAIR